jgi:hypothetical protein
MGGNRRFGRQVGYMRMMIDDGVYEIKVVRKAKGSVSGCGVNQAEKRRGERR